MLAPLSGKLKMKMMLDQAKSQADEQRKQEKHDLTLDAQAKKANLGFQFATRDQIIKEKAKTRDLGLAPSPVPPLNPIPEMEEEYDQPTNPEAGPSDVVPAMLAEGEAVIPAKAAQDPENKAVIASLVNEGRQGFAKGTVSVPKPGKNRTGIVEYDNLLPTIPIVGVRRKLKGYAAGSVDIGDERENYMALARTLGRVSADKEPESFAIIAKELQDQAGVVNNGRVTPVVDVNAIPRAQADYDEIVREMSRNKSPDAQAILQGELDKAKKTLAMKSPLYDVQVASPDSFTGVNPDSPNKNLRAQGTNAILQPNGTVTTTNTSINGATAQGIPPIQTLDQFNDWKRSRHPGYVDPPQIDALAGMPRNEAGLAGAELQPVPQPELTDPVAINAHLGFVGNEFSDRIGLEADTQKAAVASGEKTTEEATSFMQDFLSGIFGKDGIINSKTLSRFALLGAGGLMTGGSVNGSLKYAALDSLKQYDSGNQARAASAAEQSKNTRELGESRQAQYNTALATTEVTPEVKRKAIEMAGGGTVSNYNQAIQFLAANSQAKPSKENQPKYEMGYVGDTLVPIVIHNGNRYQQSPDGKLFTPKQPVLTSAEYGDFDRRTGDDFVARITPELELETGPDGKPIGTAAATSKAKQMSTWFSGMRKDFGGALDHSALGALQANTVTQLKESGKLNSRLSEAGYKAALYGNAAIALHPNDKSLFMTQQGDKTVPPSGESLVKFGSAVTNYAKKENIPFEKASSDLINAWKLLQQQDPKKAQRMTTMANAVKDQTISPMMFWAVTEANK